MCTSDKYAAMPTGLLIAGSCLPNINMLEQKDANSQGYRNGFLAVTYLINPGGFLPTLSSYKILDKAYPAISNTDLTVNALR